MPARIVHFLAMMLEACAAAANALEPQDLHRRIVDGLFQRPEATTPVEGFHAYDGTWSARDGVLFAGAGPGPKLVCDEPGWTAGEVGVELLLPDNGGGNAGLIVKVSDPGSGVDRFNGYEISLDAQGQYLRLGRHRQNFEHIRDVPCPVPVNQWIPLVVRMTERTLAIDVQGRTVLQYEDTQHPLATGQVGFRPWQRAAQFRNFWVATNGQKKPIALAAPNGKQPDDVVRGWHAIRRGSARGHFGVQSLSAVRRRTSQRITFLDGAGEVGLEYRGSDGAGLACDGGQSYVGSVWVRCEQPAEIRVVAETADGEGLAEAKLPAAAPGAWQALAFVLTPSRDEPSGRLAITLRSPGTVEIGRVLLQHWHLWRVNTDGTGLQQLTDGPYYDISPCLLPTGDILFVSTRRFGYTLCQPGPSSDLHVLSTDGQIRCVSMNTLSDMSPQMLPDGRALFTRWECIDRDLTFRQSLWTQYPDGTAYDNLLGRSRSYRQHDMETGEMLASERAKGKPLVHFYRLLRTPTAVNQPLWTGSHASRLLDYLTAEHREHEIPPDDRQRIYLWIDANVPYYGTYAHSRPRSPGRRDLCTDVTTGQLSAWFSQDFLGVYNRRCKACHGAYKGTTDWEGRFAWINFTHPHLSPALTAHLSREAGGRGIDKAVQGQRPPRFTTTADPDCQIMLHAIEAGHRLALETPEADMPGFRGPTRP
jgi:hypothetical protein